MRPEDLSSHKVTMEFKRFAQHIAVDAGIMAETGTNSRLVWYERPCREADRASLVARSVRRNRKPAYTVKA